ncbi:MAG: serine hydroxymethyltransferase, partial [Candidatus Bathyarchaeia archaeon]
GNPERGREVADKLERANIIVDTAVRIGTCEVTRRGMKTPEMSKIAELIKRAVDGENPETIKREVSKLCSEFREIKYCY